MARGDGEGAWRGKAGAAAVWYLAARVQRKKKNEEERRRKGRESGAGRLWLHLGR